MTHTLGLKENWKQFTLLVGINALVGALIGTERSMIPELAETVFGLHNATAILSFIAVFGLSKAIANFLAGRLANQMGRKNLLVLGWIFALPVPLLMYYSQSWNGILLANLFLGINQGLCWSSTVVMKIDLVGPKNRGLAMGINESSGYLAVGVGAFLSAYFAVRFGLRLSPFILGSVFIALALPLSFFFAKDTMAWVVKDKTGDKNEKLQSVFWESSWKNKNLSSITQAGLVNNLNDGMMWGLLPIFLASHGYHLKQIGLLVAIYPMVWGIGQLFTGKLGDVFNKKSLLVAGMVLQALALVLFPFFSSFILLALLSGLLGIGTALVYPNFLAAISDLTQARQRAEAIGVFRLWRDLGYVFGALLTGFLAQNFSIKTAMLAVAILTLLSAIQLQRKLHAEAFNLRADKQNH